MTKLHILNKNTSVVFCIMTCVVIPLDNGVFMARGEEGATLTEGLSESNL